MENTWSEQLPLVATMVAMAATLQTVTLWRQHRHFKEKERAGLRMLDDLADFAVVADESGRIRHVSDKIRRYGIDPARLVGQPWEAVTSDCNLSSCRAAVAEILAQGNCGPAVLQFLTGTCSPRLLEMTGVRANFGRGTLIVGLFRDVTDRRDMERALARMDRLAAVAHLAAGVAHNFNNIFAGIVLNGELITTRAEPVVAGLAERIVAGAENGAELCHRLLAVARGEPPALRLVEAAPVIADLVSLFQTEARRYGVEVSVDLSTPLEVLADANQLRQILLNLLLNAREAAGTSGWIRLRTSRSRTEAAIHVTNSGSPIPPEHLPLIFLPFFSTKRDEVQGTGLGLALCHSLAEGMGGRIEVVSSRDVPTTFTLVLPLGSGKEGAASAAADR